MGPPGSGKKEAAMTAAAQILGKIPHPDLIEISPEKDSIKIEPIRALLQRLSLKPFGEGRIVIIVDHVECLTEAAANALLKTLEEPPPYAVFLLITESIERILPTIRSRCQKVLFHLATDALKKNLSDQFSGLEHKERFLSLCRKPSFAQASQLAETLAKDTTQIDPFLSWLKILWHDLPLMEASPQEVLLPEEARSFAFLVTQKKPPRFFSDYDDLLETERALEGHVNKTLALERLFVKLTANS